MFKKLLDRIFYKTQRKRVGGITRARKGGGVVPDCELRGPGTFEKLFPDCKPEYFEF